MIEPKILTPIMIEPIRQNLWKLSFPDDFDLPEYCAAKVSAIKYSNTSGWKKIIITLHDLIGVKATKKLTENLMHIPIKVTLEKLDATGVCVEKIEIFSKSIDIDFGRFDYTSDDLAKIKIKIKPTKVRVS
jgi:hypothetical protein